MSIHHISSTSVAGAYLLSADAHLPAHLDLLTDDRTDHFTEIGSSLFLRTEDNNLLVKCVLDKYAPTKNTFGKWLSRDVISKRLMGDYDARREYQSARVLKQCGQRVVECHGYGISLNPFNRYGSLYVMRYEHALVSGKEHFSAMGDAARWHFLERFVHAGIDLAKQGYFHRDFHYGNVLVDTDEAFVWIDSHVKALSSKPEIRAKQLFGMISATKLGGVDYAAWAQQRLASNFPEVEHFFGHRVSHAVSTQSMG